MNALVIADLFLLLFLGLMDNQTIPALLPAMGRTLSRSAAGMGLIVVFYSLAAAWAAFLVGSLSDYYGRKRFLQAGALMFSLASTAAFVSHSFLGLAMARTLTGFAAGVLSTCAIAYAGDWFAYAVRGRALGWITSAYFLAPAGVPIAAIVADRQGWHRVFLYLAILAGALTVLAFTLPQEGVRAASSASRLRTTGRAFRTFLARRDTSAMLAIAFLVSGGLVSFITYVGEWLHARFGTSTTTIGLVFLLGGGAAAAGAPLGGAAADRWGKRSISIASNILLAAGLILLPFLSWGAGLLAAFAAVSLGAALRQAPITALVTEMVPQVQRGSFVALRNIASQLGIGATVFAGGYLYERYGYAAVCGLAALMTALVVVLLGTSVAEPLERAADN